MKIEKKVGLYVLAGLLLMLLCFIIFRKSNSVSTLEVLDYSAIAAKGKLVVVTDYSPIGYFVKDDSVTGFNYELLQIFRKYIDLEIEIQLESSLEKSLDGLASGEYNVLARSIPVTSDLRSIVLFTSTITQNKQILVQRKQEYNDSIMPIRSHLDLVDKTIYVPKNSPVILRINNLSKEIGDTIKYIEDDVYGSEQLAIMVAQREIDFTVCDEKTAKKLAASQPELDLETMFGFTQFEAWAVSKDSPILLDSLNTWIDRAKKTKQYDHLYKLYYY